ncbi:RNA-guided endonuclease IscB [Desulfocicer vacuolatum]|nr:RNA-guided endonuclease IscB [Desulfocicer vacuolatum]
MLVFVLNQKKEPLMPCKPSKAKRLLKEGKAKVINRMPFTIKLIFGSSGYKQPVIVGMDTGSKVIGCAAIANNQVVYQSEIQIRQDVSKKMQVRKNYRRTRRGRKTRYRPARWANRASMKKKGRLAPSIKSKVESHLREKVFVESLLPVTEWIVETASFDIHKINNPNVNGKSYQDGNQKGFYNIKAYILSRDNYKCQSRQKVEHSKKLNVHHIVFRSKGGTNTPDNLITLCENCHKNLHAGKFKLKTGKSRTKHAAELGIVKSQLKNYWDFKETFGYETKYFREQILKLDKTHYLDAVAICGQADVKLLDKIFHKKHIPSGDYQLTKGKRSEKKIPTGKLFGLRKFDLIRTSKAVGFIKGKRSSGYFALMDIFNNTLTASVNVKKDCQRLTARTTTIIQEMAIPPLP